MKTGTKKLYSRKRPAHPDEAHTSSKRWFTKKGRKAVRRYLTVEIQKQQLNSELEKSNNSR